MRIFLFLGARSEAFGFSFQEFRNDMGKRLVLLSFVVMLILPVLAQAQAGPAEEGLGPTPPRGRMMGPMHHPMADWARRLNLTEAQMEKLRELRESYLQDTLAWRNERLIQRYHLRNMLRDPKVDPAKILAKQKEISELEAKIQERTVLFQLEAREVLTPEQMQLLPRDWGGEGFEHHRMMPGRGPRMER
jgi:protein CpxP